MQSVRVLGSCRRALALVGVIFALLLLQASAARATETTFEVDPSSFVQLNNSANYEASTVFDVAFDVNQSGTGTWEFTTFSMPSIDQGFGSMTSFDILSEVKGNVDFNTGMLVFDPIRVRANEGDSEVVFDFVMTTEMMLAPACGGSSVELQGSRINAQGEMHLVGTAVDSTGTPTCVNGGAFSDAQFQISLEGTSDPDVVPEPGSALLMGAGLLGLGWLRRRLR